MSSFPHLDELSASTLKFLAEKESEACSIPYEYFKGDWNAPGTTPHIPYEFEVPPTQSRVDARKAASKFLSDQGHNLDGWEVLTLERILITGIEGA